MASMSYDKKNSRWIIQFLSTTGSRKSVSMKATRGKDKGSGKAAALRNHIEELGMAIKTGTSIPPRVVSWAIDLLEKTHSQLVSAGLLKQRIDPELSTLRPFLTKWFADRSGTKHSTEITW